MSAKILSNRVMSIGEYLEMVTGQYYNFGPNVDSDIAAAEIVLKHHGLGFKNHAFTEIEKIFENELSVVLVECLEWNEGQAEYEHQLRWFELADE